MRSSTHHLAAVLVTGFGLTAPAGAATLNVPADYPTIQSCIDAAVSGQDECVVAPGIYNELINFLGKAITLRSSHGPEVTTIDGTGLNGSVVTFDGGETIQSVLDGFTITGGVGGDDQYARGYAGGIQVYESSPTIIRNIISDNINEDGYGGGGLYLRESLAVIANNVIQRNRATYAGGLLIDHGSPAIIENIIRNNFALQTGGLGGTHCNSVISRNIIIGNRSSSIAAGIAFGYSSPTLDNNLIVGNFADAMGAGLLIAGFEPKLRNNTIAFNVTGFGGGSVHFFGSSTISQSPELTSTIVALNTPGVCASTSENVFPVFQDSNFWANGTFNFSNVEDPIGTNGNISVSPIFRKPPSNGGDGWGDNPRTVIDESANDDFGDLRLQPGSPCINAGDPGFVPQPSETDLDGHGRVLCGRVDMGAYEFGIGDYDCDQTLTLRDVAGLQNCYAGQGAAPYEPGCESLDFEFDGDVDLADLAAFEKAFRP